MNKKTTLKNSATIVNPWDESSLAKELFEQVKSGFETNTDLTEECFWEEDDMKFYILCPTAIKTPENHFVDNFHYAYSMIFGYFVIDDGDRKYKLYADENTFLQILENLYLFGDRERHEQDYYVEICQYADALIEYKIVDHFKKELNIEHGFCCQKCKSRLDENSFSAIVKSNPEIASFIEAKYINCPSCGAAIEIDENINDKLRSYQTIYKFRLFSEQHLGKEFQVKFIAILLFDKIQSEFLKELQIEKIDDPLCRELFGISKKEFDSFWYFFRIDINNHVYRAVKKFIYYEEDQKHAKYIQSKKDEVLRYLRRRKIERLNEKSME